MFAMTDLLFFDIQTYFDSPCLMRGTLYTECPRADAQR